MNRYVVGIGTFFLFIPIGFSDASAQSITFSRNIALKIGQSVIVHGIRGRTCSDGAPSWSQAKAELPSSSLGSFSDGGVGTRNSRACGGMVPARAVRFKAIRKGSEVLNIQQDPISVTIN
ncbi:hypothetical protein [Chelatococcus sp.]|uniref:hypothetical protein n=1 Tax=Chelatococcus sp. TaxID=1953771 RepID=UPI001ED00745|nr:hypothetical protein [Chelatococcus sp.]MBX3547430.1 hypothetical protein [Chelatococcus sp.]